jgi:hypothetical protein
MLLGGLIGIEREDREQVFRLKASRVIAGARTASLP